MTNNTKYLVVTGAWSYRCDTMTEAEELVARYGGTIHSVTA